MFPSHRPSRFRLQVAREAAGFPPDSYAPHTREVAFRDYLARRFALRAREAGADRRTEEGGWQGPKGGELLIDAPGQHALQNPTPTPTPAPTLPLSSLVLTLTSPMSLANP